MTGINRRLLRKIMMDGKRSAMKARALKSDRKISIDEPEMVQSAPGKAYIDPLVDDSPRAMMRRRFGLD